MCGTTLTASRKKTGFSKPKGYKAIAFSAWSSDNLITNTAGVVSVMPEIMPIYRFEVKNTADNFVETADKDLTTMTGAKTGAGTFALMYCDRVANLADAQALLDGTWNVFFEGNDGKTIVAGTVNGADVTSIVESTDAQGFLFTIASMEPIFAQTLNEAAVTEYKALVVATA